jgi:predicted metal-dependent peptidase
MRPHRQAKFLPGPVVEVGDSTEDRIRQSKILAAKVLSTCAPAIKALMPVLVPVEKDEQLFGGNLTMAVDSYYRLYVSDKFTQSLVDDAEAVSHTNPCQTCGATKHHRLAYVGGVIAHEAWHPLRKHSVRFKNVGLKDWKAYNVAADLEINDDLLEAFKSAASTISTDKQPKLCLPPGCIWPAKLREIPTRAMSYKMSPSFTRHSTMTPEEINEDLKKLSMKEQMDFMAHQWYTKEDPGLWKLFEDNKLAEEYYALIPEPPPCPVHGGGGGKGSSGTGEEKEDGQGQPGGGGDHSCSDGHDHEEPSEGGDSAGHKEGEHKHGNSGRACTCPWESDHGSGAGGPQRKYELGAPNEDNPGVSEAEGKAIARQVAREIKARGNQPGGMDLWAEKELEAAKYNWRQELSKACVHGVGRRHGHEQRSYSRLGTLTMATRGAVIFPSTYDPLPNVTVILDTSGSMGPSDLKAGCQETNGVLKSLNANIRFTCVDMHATELADITDISQVSLKGGGGTDMRVGIEAALKDTKQPPDVIIVMTDGHTPWPDVPLNGGQCVLICCLVGVSSATLESVPSWAIGIKIVEDTVEKRAEA